jgi:hypothetical protein
VELIPDDGWSFFSCRASVIFFLPILVALSVYAHQNRIAPVSSVVSLVILALVFAAFCCLAGTSGQTWADPLNAIGILLISFAFLVDGFFIAGAATFGPTPVLDVGVYAGQNERDACDIWRDGRWIQTRLSGRISDQEYEQFRRWADNLEFTNDLTARPGRIQLSIWDGQVYRITMKNRRPPLTIGGPPRSNPRCFLELLCSITLMIFALRVYREGKRRGIHLRKSDSLSLW